MSNKWYKNAYRRCVVDMHIADWDEKFLSELNPENYVNMLFLSKVKSTVLCAISHTGLCNYPTKVGCMHNGLKGRDVLRELIDLCHKNEIAVVIYVSLIFNNWAHDNHPDWRIIKADGKEVSENSRYGVCCPNSPYRDFAIKQIEEICFNYDFEGIRFDMTFWPAVCYCKHCQERYAKEVGGDIPKLVNWLDPNWVKFQRRREAWLVDFASLVTSTVKRLKPDVSVEHQSSTYHHSWKLGVTTELSNHSDFLQGDFYGGALEGSFICKLLYNLTENLPFGFETPASYRLADPSMLKPKELLRAKAYSAVANGGAFIFIDSIDPEGTLDERVYKTMRDVFDETRKYEKYLGGKLCQDVAIYFSTESKFDFLDNGKNVLDASERMPHLDAALNAAKYFIEHHIPYGVITKKNIKDLYQYKAVLLPNVLMMNEEEAKAFRSYVENGGGLYASKYTSLTSKDGIRMDDFMLNDVFGVSYFGETKEDITYISPTLEGKDIFEGYVYKYPLSICSTQVKVKAKNQVKILGKMALPYTDPKDPKLYVSIHGNPPGVVTEYAAIVFNEYCKGRAIYVSGEMDDSEIHGNIFIRLIKLLAKGPFTFESNAPKSVEIVAFHQEDKNRYIINLLNFQDKLPNIPVDGIRVKMWLGDRSIKRLTKLPEEIDVNYKVNNEYAEFIAPRLETFLMLALDYEQN